MTYEERKKSYLNRYTSWRDSLTEEERELINSGRDDEISPDKRSQLNEFSKQYEALKKDKPQKKDVLDDVGSIDTYWGIPKQETDEEKIAKLNASKFALGLFEDVLGVPGRAAGAVASTLIRGGKRGLLGLGKEYDKKTPLHKDISNIWKNERSGGTVAKQALLGNPNTKASFLTDFAFDVAGDAGGLGLLRKTIKMPTIAGKVNKGVKSISKMPRKIANVMHDWGSHDFDVLKEPLLRRGGTHIDTLLKDGAIPRTATAKSKVVALDKQLGEGFPKIYKGFNELANQQGIKGSIELPVEKGIRELQERYNQAVLRESPEAAKINATIQKAQEFIDPKIGYKTAKDFTKPKHKYDLKPYDDIIKGESLALQNKEDEFYKAAFELHREIKTLNPKTASLHLKQNDYDAFYETQHADRILDSLTAEIDEIEEGMRRVQPMIYDMNPGSPKAIGLMSKYKDMAEQRDILLKQLDKAQYIEIAKDLDNYELKDIAEFARSNPEFRKKYAKYTRLEKELYDAGALQESRKSLSKAYQDIVGIEPLADDSRFLALISKFQSQKLANPTLTAENFLKHEGIYGLDRLPLSDLIQLKKDINALEWYGKNVWAKEGKRDAKALASLLSPEGEEMFSTGKTIAKHLKLEIDDTLDAFGQTLLSSKNGNKRLQAFADDVAEYLTPKQEKLLRAGKIKEFEHNLGDTYIASDRVFDFMTKTANTQGYIESTLRGIVASVFAVRYPWATSNVATKYVKPISRGIGGSALNLVINPLSRASKKIPIKISDNVADATALQPVRQYLEGEVEKRKRPVDRELDFMFSPQISY